MQMAKKKGKKATKKSSLLENEIIVCECCSRWKEELNGMNKKKEEKNDVSPWPGCTL